MHDRTGPAPEAAAGGARAGHDRAGAGPARGGRWASGPSASSTRRRIDALADLSAQLGRPVTAGRVRLALLRGRVEVRDIVVGRDPDPAPGARPGLQAGPGLRRRLAGAGHPLAGQAGRGAGHPGRATADPGVARQGRPPELAAHRREAGQGRAATKSEPMDAATRERVEGLVVRNLRVDDARLRFVDLAREGAQRRDRRPGRGPGRRVAGARRSRPRSRRPCWRPARTSTCGPDFAAAPGRQTGGRCPPRRSRS